MSSAITRLGQWAASVFVLVLGCNTDTRIEYQHDPTTRLETDHTLNRAELAPFTMDGVVVAPLFRMLTPQSTQVWLKLWAPGGKTVSARAAQLTGTGAQSAQSQQFPAEKSATTEKTDVKGVQYGLILLGEVGNDALAALASTGSAKLTVELKVSPAADYRSLSFDITRHKTKQWATH